MGYENLVNFEAFALLNKDAISPTSQPKPFFFFILISFFWVQIWDVLSNKEVVDIIASAPARTSAARALVESAVRAWRYKYPTSKVDDCAVVCLYLDSDNIISSAAKQQLASTDAVNSGTEKEVSGGPTGLNHSQTVRNGKEILPEDTSKEDASDEIYSESGVEWSALEGVSRVNTLLTLPRFVPGKDDKKARK